MAVPISITDLTVDESTNFPPDTETVTATTRPSDYLRAHASILRRPWAKGADVASATAANLGSNTDGDYFHITGTTGIAASNFGTVDAGIERTIVFDGALLLTHNGTSFILPGAANITTAAGDVAVFRSEGSGNWRCVGYQRAGSYQPLDAELSAIAGLTSAANKVPRFTGSGTAEVIDVVYGTYTPTVTGVTNVSAVGTVHSARYIRVGNIVEVKGFHYFTPTSTAFTVMRISLPIASDIITANDDLTGVGVPSGAQDSANIVGDTTNNEAQLDYTASVAGSTSVSWSFSYIVQ